METSRTAQYLYPTDINEGMFNAVAIAGSATLANDAQQAIVTPGSSSGAHTSTRQAATVVDMRDVDCATLYVMSTAAATVAVGWMAEDKTTVLETATPVALAAGVWVKIQFSSVDTGSTRLPQQFMRLTIANGAAPTVVSSRMFKQFN